jgi:hypothetical protein
MAIARCKKNTVRRVRAVTEARCLLVDPFMIKKLALLGAAIGGAVLLQDRTRRERLMSSVKKFIDRGRESLAEARTDRGHVPHSDNFKPTGHTRPNKPADTIY